MSLSLRHMKAFIAISEQLNFGQAARRLNVSQPALTRTIKELEQSVGTALLLRTTRSVRISRAGEVFLQQARDVVLRSEQAVTAAREAAIGPTEYLRIGYMDSAIHGPLIPALVALKEEYENLQVVLHRDRSETQSSYVASGRLDLGITIQHPFQAGLDVLPLTSAPLCVVLPERHPLAQQDEIRLSQLRHEAFVLGEPAVWYRYLRIVYDFCAQEGIVPRISVEAQESPTMFKLVAAGFGVTVYPDIAGARTMTGLAFRPFVDPAPKINSYAISRRSGLSTVGGRLLSLMRMKADEAR